jgi:hypothetical protein
MTDPYGRNGPSYVPPQGSAPQNPYPGQPYVPNGQPQNPYVPQPYGPGSQPQNPYPSAQGHYPPVQGQYPPAPGQYPPAQGAPTPSPYALAPGQPAPTQGPPPSAARTKVVRSVLSWVLILALAGAGWFIYKNTGAAAMKVNDCVAITGTKSSPDAKKVSCTDATAIYKVTALDVTCDENESEYTETIKGLSTKLCLFYNVTVGECIAKGTASKVSSKGACTPGTYKVLATKDDTADENTCPDMTEFTLPNTTRNKLICLVQVT